MLECYVIKIHIINLNPNQCFMSLLLNSNKHYKKLVIVAKGDGRPAD